MQTIDPATSFTLGDRPVQRMGYGRDAARRSARFRAAEGP